ncbi:hypothetical protein TraAM80_07207 [Trypanosoma rangeli]|uniref:Uncharacterized protein n=1 Tax=Trypanosoma rangeli TaxID=5698 RepID=A0A3R7LPV2_TRYRA|nr:uncharacterized protein TraAM80_07207 [Trypanosoma rangeli]RNF01107.1 hypothetical protein TraAM80_07207 [Trypanosoma rangeli]|eukprot:RNF01107.1 hypothetical protein TraAM80_07207 [Trypanosoma rangeli]
MALTEKSCLRIRLTLYVLFIVSYAVGVVVFIKHFKNYWAGAGFLLACVLIALTALMHIVQAETLCKRFSPGSKSRVLFQSVVLTGTLGLLGVAMYLLARGLMLRQRWTGESHFCSFIAFANAAKWCCLIGYRLHNARIAPDAVEERLAEEKLNLFEDLQDDLSTEEKKNGCVE